METSSIIFDTNIWIGLFVSTDSLHKKSVEILREYETRMKCIPEYILLETLTLLKKQLTIAESQHCLNIFLHSQLIEILPAVYSYDKTINLFQNLNDKQLSFVDMSLLALSRDYTVKTFDKKLAAAIKKFNK
jgi:predicted nucleic acid-binding protein